MFFLTLDIVSRFGSLSTCLIGYNYIEVKFLWEISRPPCEWCESGLLISQKKCFRGQSGLEGYVMPASLLTE